MLAMLGEVQKKESISLERHRYLFPKKTIHAEILQRWSDCVTWKVFIFNRWSDGVISNHFKATKRLFRFKTLYFETIMTLLKFVKRSADTHTVGRLMSVSEDRTVGTSSIFWCWWPFCNKKNICIECGWIVFYPVFHYSLYLCCKIPVC